MTEVTAQIGQLVAEKGHFKKAFGEAQELNQKLREELTTLMERFKAAERVIDIAERGALYQRERYTKLLVRQGTLDGMNENQRLQIVAAREREVKLEAKLTGALATLDVVGKKGRKIRELRSRLYAKRTENEEIRKQLNDAIETTALYRKRQRELEGMLQVSRDARNNLRKWVSDLNSRLAEINELSEDT